MLTAITHQRVAYLPKAATQMVVLGLLNALVSVTFEKCDIVGFLIAGHIVLASYSN